jgi:sodium-dependent dicarboxylate transporter 2/3/5
MFLPGVQLLTWKQADRSIGWDTLLMIGGVTSLGSASLQAGLANWLVDLTLRGVADWSIVLALVAISAFTVVVHLALPIGPVVNAVVIPPIALLAVSAGVNPALYALPVAFTASCAFLLPLDAVCLITYSKGYYRMHDMLTPGVLIGSAWVVWMTILMLTIGGLLGFV